MISLFRSVSIILPAVILVGAAQLAAQSCPPAEWRSPTPFYYDLWDVVFANGVFLAPAGYSHVAISGDGTSWTLHRVTDAQQGLWKAHWDGSQFIVGAGQGLVYTSPDGIDWTRHDVTGVYASIIAVASNGAMTLVADFTGTMAVTTDWLSWSVVAYAHHEVTALAASDSELVAVGDAGMILRSTNGFDWIDVSPGSAIVVNLHDVLWNGSQFLAVGGSGRTYRSPDGLAWEASDVGGYANALKNITWDGSRFVVTNLSTPCVYSSLDGLAWTLEAELDPELFPDGIAFGNQRYVIVGRRGANLTSTDRSTWIPHYSGPYDNLFGVASNGSQLVAVGDSGMTLSSETGMEWSAHPLPQSVDLRGIVWSGTEFLAVGELGALWASVNGESWSQRSTGGITATLYDIVAGAELVAVGEAGTIVTSSDGLSWTPVDSTVSSDLHALASNGSVYVAVGDGGTLVSSPDSTSWTARASGIVRDLRTILWDGASFYATGHNGDLVVSDDGVTWVDGEPLFSPVGSTTYDLELIQNTYIALTDYSGIMMSFDMTNWSDVSEWEALQALAPSATGAVAVSYSGLILGLECWGIIFTDGFENGSTSHW